MLLSSVLEDIAKIKNRVDFFRKKFSYAFKCLRSPGSNPQQHFKFTSTLGCQSTPKASDFQRLSKKSKLFMIPRYDLSWQELQKMIWVKNFDSRKSHKRPENSISTSPLTPRLWESIITFHKATYTCFKPNSLIINCESWQPFFILRIFNCETNLYR